MSRGWKSAATRAAGALALVGLLALAGCGGAPRRSADGTAAPGAAAAPGSLTAGEAKAFLAAHPEALVLDVRNPDEWNDALGHIEAARQIPLPELGTRLAEISEWRERPVVAVCAVGARSARAADLLARSGFREVYNLEGGMQAWRAQGY